MASFSSLFSAGLSALGKVIVIDVEGNLKTVSEDYSLLPGEVFVTIDDEVVLAELPAKEGEPELSTDIDQILSSIEAGEDPTLLVEFATAAGVETPTQEKIIIIDIAGNIKIVPANTVLLPGEVVLEDEQGYLLFSESDLPDTAILDESGELRTLDTDPEIDQIFAALEAGADPTQIEELAPAAGGGAAGSSIGTSGEIERTGTQVLAATSFDTSGLASQGVSETQSLSLLNLLQIAAVNQSPVAQNSSAALDEDTSISGQVLATDADLPAGSTLTYATTSTATGLTFDSDGTYTFDASSYDSLSEGQILVITVPYTATDNQGATGSGTLTITITGTNDAPVAQAESFSVNEDETFSGQMDATDIDLPAGSVLNFSITDTIEGLTFNTDGSYTFDASSYDYLQEGQTQQIPVVVTVTDEAGGTDTTILTITIVGTNDASVVSADTRTLTETNSVLTSSGTLTSTDVDGPDNSFTANTITNDFGTFTIDANGNWTFSSNGAFDHLRQGEEASFIYPVTTTDGTETTVTITIQGTNDLPVVEERLGGWIHEDETRQIVKNLVVQDPDNTNHDFEVVGGIDPADSVGVFKINSDGVWTFELIPGKADYLKEGQKLFETYQVKVTDEDGGEIIVEVTVGIVGTNDASAVSSDSVTLVETDSVLTSSGTLTSTDVDGPDNSFVANSITNDLGTFTMDENGNWTFTASSTFDHLRVGEEETFTYPVTTSDGTESSVTITIQGTNDLPVVEERLGGWIHEDETRQIVKNLVVQDLDNDNHTFEVVGGIDPADSVGVFKINSDGVWTFELTPGKADYLKEGQKLFETYKVKVTDEDGGITIVDVTVGIVGQNDAAIVSSDVRTLVETDSVLSTSGTLTSTDVDGPDNSFVANSITNSLGTFAIDENGNWTFTASETFDSLRVGEELSFTYPVETTDGATSSVEIIIQGTNDLPVVEERLGGWIHEDETRQIVKNLVVQDLDNDNHTFEVVGTPATVVGTFAINSDGVWTYELTPGAADYLKEGQKLFETYQVKVTDEDGGVTIVDVTVGIVGQNDAAIVSSDSVTLVETDSVLTSSGTLTSTDVDGPDNSFVANSVTNSLGTFTIDENGNWTFTASSTFDHLRVGEEATFTYPVTTTDGATSSVEITIQGTNDLPVVEERLGGWIHEDETRQIVKNLVVQDLDNDNHTFEVVGSVPGAVGTFLINSDGVWTYELTPGAADYLKEGQKLFETYQVKVTDEDGGVTIVDVTVGIVGQNDAPVIDSTISVTGSVAEDTAGSSVATGQLVATDPDNDTAPNTDLTWSDITANPSQYGNFVIDSGTGEWTFQIDNTLPAVQALSEGQSVTETFTVQVSDGMGTDTQEVVITITGTNDAPVAQNASVGVNEDASITGNVTATDVDLPAGSSLNYSTTSTATGLTFNSDGSYSFDASSYDSLSEGETLVIQVPYTATDEQSAVSNTGMLTITITGTNDDPVADAKVVDVQEDASISGQMTATDVDLPAGESLTFNTTSTATGLTFNSDGSYTFDASSYDYLPAGQVLEIVVPVTVTDEAGGTATTTLTIKVTGTNDAAVVDSATKTLRETDAALTTGGTLTSTDVDGTDNRFNASTTNGTIGTFSINANGVWTFVANKAFDELNVGDKVEETYNVTTEDGTPTTVTVVIEGTNDGPVIDETTGVSGTVKEDVAASATATGTLVATDPDNDTDPNQDMVWTDVTTGSPTYGSFSIDSGTGQWTYQINNSLSAVQSLAEGQTVTETFTVQVSDGSATDTQEVTVTVTGTNDDPVVTGGKFADTVIEDSQTTASGAITFDDVDTLDTHTWVVSGGGTGTYGNLTIDNDGNWQYVLDAVKSNSLHENQKETETFTVTLSDGKGGTVSKTIEISVVGSNDLPSVTGGTTGDVEEDNAAKQNATGTLAIQDPDVPDNAEFTLLGSDTQTYGSFSIDKDTGEWEFVLDNSAAQTLSEGQEVTHTFTVQIEDDYNGIVTQDVVITIKGDNDQPSISGTQLGQLKEDTTLTATGSMDVADVDLNDVHSWTMSNGGVGKYGSISIDANGDWTYTLNNSSKRVQQLAEGQKAHDFFTVTVSDGQGGTDSKLITIEVTGTNDVPRLGGSRVGTVTEDGTLSVSKQLKPSDVDKTDTHQWEVTQYHPDSLGTFVLDANGKWTFTLDNDKADDLDAGDRVREEYWVKVTDNHGASTTKKVVITIEGTNDIPALDGDLAGEVTEDTQTTTTGQLLDGDPDADDSHTFAVLNPQGLFGELTVNSDGSWSYDLTNTNSQVQALAVGETLTDTYRVTVTDSHGEKTEKNLVITIKGNNDDPEITGKVSGTVIEATAGQLETDGQLAALDVDTSDTHTWSVTAPTGTYGSLSVDPNTGKWTYVLDSGKPATQALDAGEVAQDKFTIEVDDGNGGTATKEIIINVVGTNSDPSIVGDDTGDIKELAGTSTPTTPNTTTGTLGSGDPDGDDSHTWMVVDPSGTYGTLSIDSDGKWTFTLNDGSNVVNELDEGDTTTDTFTVRATDSFGQQSESQVVITIEGTNDAPTLNGSALSKTVTEDGASSVSGQLNSGDPDKDDGAEFGISGAHPAGEGTYGNLVVDSSTGQWTYTLKDPNSPAIQELSPTTSLTETFTVFVKDDAGEMVSKPLTITIAGTNDEPVISGDTEATYKEDTGTGSSVSLTGTLNITDIDKDVASGSDTDTVDSAKIVSSTFAGNLGTLTIDVAGNWEYLINNDSPQVQGLREGETYVETFTILGEDEFGAIVSKDLAITVKGTNDIPEVFGDDAGTVTVTKSETAKGMVLATDVDSLDDVKAWTVESGDGTYGVLSIDGTTGEWIYTIDSTKSMPGPNDTATDTFYVRAEDLDGGVSEKFAIVINVQGSNFPPVGGGGSPTNDQPDIGGDITGSVTEDSLTAESGQLTVTDPDTGDSHTWSLINSGGTAEPDNKLEGTYGTLELNPATGKWHYVLNNNDPAVQNLKPGETVQETFTVKVTDSSGEANDSDTQTITIDVVGSADHVQVSNPVIETAVVKEDAVTTDSGTLTTPAGLGAGTWHLPSGVGQFGTLTLDSSGNWTYNLNSANPTVNQLKEGAKLTETFEVVVVDQYGKTTVDASGNPIKLQVEIDITGTNDAPNITGELTNSIANSDSDGKITGDLNPGDPDVGDTHTWRLPNETASNEEEGTYGKLILNPTTGEYEYQLDSSNNTVKNLGQTETLTETFDVIVKDDNGLESTDTVTITITGSNDAPVITGATTGTAEEDSGIAASGKLNAVEANTDDSASFVAKEGANALQGTYGKFEIDADGNWTYNLFDGQPHIEELSPDSSITESFIVTAVDSFGVTTRETVTVTITGTNDDPVVSGDSTGVVAETAVTTATGQLVTADVDDNDTATYSVTTVASYGTLSVNPSTGAWQYVVDSNNATVNSLGKGSSITDTAEITVTDKFGGTDTITVNITINGENDAPSIFGNLATDTDAEAQEESITTVTGQLQSGDPDMLDSPDTHTWEVLNDNSPYGSMDIDQNGEWTFNLENSHADIQKLGAGEEIEIQYQIKVSDQHDVSDTQTVTITVKGTNDLPVVTGPVTGATAEDGTSTATGDLDVSDIDENDTHTWSVSGSDVGTYGSISVDANGVWTYTLNNASDAVQNLAAGQTEQDTFQISVFDGTDTVTKTVTIDVTGSNDTPSITGDTSDSISQDATASVTGDLNVSDKDLSDTHSWSIVGSDTGKYGELSLNTSTGEWEYTINNSLAGSNALGQGQTEDEVFTVMVSDGQGGTKEQDVTITVSGRNDAPQVTAVVVAGTTTLGFTASAVGSLTATDPDANNTSLTWSVSNPSGTYGNLSIDQSGQWTYSIDESKPDTTDLVAGVTKTETFTIEVEDSHGAVSTETVTVTVNGSLFDGTPTTGNDILIATDDDEIFYGDPKGSAVASQDTFVWQPGSLGTPAGHDIIREFDVSNDRLDLSAIVAADNVSGLSDLTSNLSLSESSGNTYLNVSNGSGTIQTIELEGIGLGSLLSHASPGSLSPEEQIERLLDNGSLILSDNIGDSNANTISGDSSADSLFGLSGNDILDGDGGDDLIAGGSGNDILTGGAGNDLFIWYKGETDSAASHDQITDFELSGGDKLDLRDILPDTVDGNSLSSLLGHISATVSSDSSTLELVVTPESGMSQAIDVVIGNAADYGLSMTSTSSDIVNELMNNNAFKWD
ncbi:putative VCBS repeat and Serralysin domain protein [Vibrio nigripulchritudo SOn1]|uniref:VCBS repeat and Serralysin domain protein n=1 Tax=Vibrio nigripulchritudo SOn1 TaxID=1238450 RepID=A0AAV2VMW7_9VIBR|nr:VCBS domain-containing protein [Vibrio nigripulchritudo]CCO46078.1 putative VCBS repeat and Serralysin domain protein [Vibrio nigripulchritudo SOn1]